MGDTWVDYGKVKEAVSIEAVFDRIGHPYRRRPGGGLEATCPIHQGHNRRQFKVSPSGRGFHCFGAGCRKGGNVIDLVAFLECLPFREAAIKLARDFRVPGALARRARQLPIVKIHGKRFFQDDRLREFRGVDNPYDRIPFSKMS